MDDETLVLLIIAGAIGIGIGFGVKTYLDNHNLPPSAATPKSTYNNLEEWEFLTEGRHVKGLKVHRRAEIA